MELNRRKFCQALAGAVAGLWCGAWRLMARAVPERVLQTLRAGRYPGRVRALDDREAAKPGRWQG